MSYFRSLSATVLSAAATFSLVTASCGTSAVGVDDCRDIEQARCRAGASCVDSSGAPVIEDVDACERYYRDHCLHGLALKPPAGASVSACVNVIEAAGRCARSDPAIALEDCPKVTAAKPGLFQACDVVTHPELATECAFLTDTESTGGQSSTDTSSGATAGQPTAAGGETAQGGAATE